MSGSFHQGLLDQQLALEMVVPTVAYVWDVAESLITFLREGTSRSRPQELGSELMQQLETLNRESKERAQLEGAGRDLLEHLDGRWARRLCALAIVLVIGGLVAVTVSAVADHAPGTTDSFLVAVAAALAVLAVVALVPMVETVTSFRRMLVIGVAVGLLALALTVGIATALDLASSEGPPGPAGERGPPGEPGASSRRSSPR